MCWCLPESSANGICGRKGARGRGQAEVLRSCPSPAREEPRRRGRLSSNADGDTADGLGVVENDGGGKDVGKDEVRVGPRGHAQRY